MEEFLVHAAPSPIHGVGVFAVTPIREGGKLQLWSDEELRFIAKPVQGALREMVETYGIEVADGYWCPWDFNRAEIGWYLNHSDNPNVTYADDITVRALRDIEAGEELTVNYREITGDFRDPKYASRK